MAHNIYAYDAEKALFGLGTPWHTLGQTLGRLFTSEEAQAAIGWRVSKTPLTLPGTDIPVPGRYLTVREDLTPDNPGRVLGVVGEKYTVIQNADMLSIGDALMTESGAHYDCAFAMKGGAVVCAVIKLPDIMRVIDDMIAEYLLLTTTHDGSGLALGFLTPVRVVCGNTHRAAMRGAGGVNKIAIRHTAQSADAVKEARRLLSAGHDHFGKLAEAFEFLATTPVDGKGVKRFLDSLLPLPEKEGPGKSRQENVRRQVEALFAGEQEGANQRAVKGTAYGLYCAATQYADHDRPARVHGDRDPVEVRAESVLFGTAADFKQTAFDAALALA